MLEEVNLNQNYFEAVTLVTIKRLNEKGISCSEENLVSHSKMSNNTIRRAILRLERKGRLEIVKSRTPSPKPFQYIIKDQPTDNEYVLAAIHLADKMEVVPNGAH